MDTEPVFDEVILRQINCKLNANTRSDGSAMFAQGKYNVIYDFLISVLII